MDDTAKEFLANVEGGIVPVTCHNDVLRIAYIYINEGLWDSQGVFDVVEKLHAYGWSFGEDELRFNRTLDIFYLAQIAAAYYHWTDQLNGDNPLTFSDFNAFYTAHHALLNPTAWRSYYSTAFLTQPNTARFYRMPDLQDLPDSSSPLCLPRDNLVSKHVLKLPRWAYTVGRTCHRQPFLPFDTITEIALRTLDTALTRLHAAYPSAPLFSEPHARFWLDEYYKPPITESKQEALSTNANTQLEGEEKIPSSSSPTSDPSPRKDNREAWGPYHFGLNVASGLYDIHSLEAQYLAQVSSGKVVKPEPSKPVFFWCGIPDGGTADQALQRGWQEEIGSEEEVEFLAAVAKEETAGLGAGAIKVDELNCSIRSHILLAVMQAALVENMQEREHFLGELERRMVQNGRIGEERAGRWVREALEIMVPYVRVWQGKWPGAEKRGEMLRQILVENPLLFARWKLSPVLRQFAFDDAKWSQMRRSRLEFHSVRPDGRWYFVGPRGEDPHDSERGGYKISATDHYPRATDAGENENLDAEYADDSNEHYDYDLDINMFRTEPCRERIEPLLTAFAKSLSNDTMSNLEDAEVYTHLWWAPSDNIEVKEYDLPMKKGHKWGVKFITERGSKKQGPNDTAAAAPTPPVVQWQVGDWRPSEEDMSLFKSLGR
ncbi:hypothetical protein N0V95_003218 [Ascochyta clinopodiicola]|nr:hypothetical protein N0V95_003218 [Ascochyta clinopodiicola]